MTFCPSFIKENIRRWEGVRMMFKKLLLSMVILATAGTTAVLGTQALVADTATLGASTYSTGSVDLKISKTGEADSFTDSIEGFPNVTLNPGDSITHTIYLKNNSLTGALKISGTATAVTGDESITSKVNIKFAKHGADPAVETSNSALATWAGATPKTFGGGFNLAAGAEQQYDMTVSLSSTAPEGSFSFSFVFTGDYTSSI